MTFNDFKIEDNGSYILQLRVNVFIENTIFNEEFLTYTFNLDLTLEKKVEIGKILMWVSIGLAIIIVIIILIVIFYKNKQLKNDNLQLKEKVLSIGYSAGIEKNILIKEEPSKKDDDYEKTFI